MEKDFLHHIKDKQVDLIVVSDSEAILGIGGTSKLPVHEPTSCCQTNHSFILHTDQGVGVSLREIFTGSLHQFLTSRICLIG